MSPEGPSTAAAAVAARYLAAGRRWEAEAGERFDAPLGRGSEDALDGGAPAGVLDPGGDDLPARVRGDGGPAGAGPAAAERSQTPGQQPEDAGLDRVWREISEMKHMLESTLRAQSGAWRHSVQFLLDQGVDERQLWELLSEAGLKVSGDTGGSPLLDRQDLRALLERQMCARVPELAGPQPIAPASRFVAFVGPTGVGKTTTIAKIAALHVLAGVRKVGLMTADTFRIAAVDQLRTYASILNVPLEVIYRPSDVPLAIERLQDCDLILIDTAGRNYRSEGSMDELRVLLQAIPVDETYLVLSVTHKPQDLDELAAAFCRLPIDKFLFTKVDETSGCGAVLNLLMRYRKPVSYITTGQNVPDDIEVASLDRLLELILGGAA
ncbi:MAG: flagellar biosynthesis protein FlhF [Alicyclobacillus sp.]|nr:flagellar biosynthesis protein FlhF [Alicyclobacillus sp.]